MKYLKDTYKIIKYNFGTLAKFEIIYKILMLLIFTPLFMSGFKLSMKLTGFSYLTIENISSYILNPVTLILILVAILFLTLVTLFDVSTMIIIYDASYNEKKISLKEIIKISLNKCKNMVKLKNIPVAFILLFLIPILDMGMRANAIPKITLPEFISDYIYNNTTLTILVTVIYIFLVILLLKWIYSIHYMVLEDKSFKEARKCSSKLAKGNKFKDLIRIILIEVLVALVYYAIMLMGILLISVLYHVLINYEIISSIIIAVIATVIVIIHILFSIISNSVSYALITTSFYIHKKDKQEEVKKFNYDKINIENKKKTVSRVVIILILTGVIAVGSIFTYKVIKGDIDLNLNLGKETEVTAHRGGSLDFPENTMAAFRGAEEAGADWIELDIQQTKDRKIVISHDTNVLRVTGVNRDIIDMTYEEISKLDAGSFFNEKFKGEKMPLLEEVLDFAKNNNVKLNIELKPTGKEIDFEKDVVELIKKYDFIDRCVVTSQVYSAVENVKKIDPNIKTLYVMSIAIGNITNLEYADNFSVEASNVNEELVNLVHNQGKKLFAWTINTEENINKMIDLNVDNIITDDYNLAVRLVNKKRNANLIEELIKGLIL